MGQKGSEILLDILRDEGVTHIFGNPGTTELPLVDELAGRTDFTYVLALQENSAVGMADGFAAASGRPAFVNLHTTTGLGGGMGNLVNSFANKTPLVVTAGQQDQRHLVTDPLLAGDLVGMARPVSKWQYEVRSAAELGTVLRRAFNDAMAPPRGPVFVSLPMDVLEEETTAPVPGRSILEHRCVAEGLEELAVLLATAGPGGVALVVGEEVASSGALAEVTALAEMLGATVFGAPFYNTLVFPTDHPLWQGVLGTTARMCRERLEPFPCIFYIGCQVGYVNHFSEGPAIPAGADLVHLSADPSLPGRTVPTRLGLVGDVRSSVAALLLSVGPNADKEAAADRLAEARQVQEAKNAKIDQRVRDRSTTAPMHPMVALSGLLGGCPPSTIVVDEAITASSYLRGFHRSGEAGSYLSCRGGGLGWGMPAAVGAKLARPDRPVLCVVGDGAAMYSVQSLYTAARHGLDMVFAVVNNQRYRILREQLERPGTRSAAEDVFVAMDLDRPAIDYVYIATGLGVAAERIDRGVDVAGAVRAAFEAGGPRLLEFVVSAD